MLWVTSSSGGERHFPVRTVLVLLRRRPPARGEYPLRRRAPVEAPHLGTSDHPLNIRRAKYVLTSGRLPAPSTRHSTHTTAEQFGGPIQDRIDMVKKESYDTSEKPLPALGRKFVSRDEERRVRKTDINSRRFKACIIPSHINVQYVEVF